MKTYDELVELGFNGEGPLKVIMKGYFEEEKSVVALVFATLDKEKAIAEFSRLMDAGYPDIYYMVYSVPLDTDLTQLEILPSIATSKDEFDQ